MIYNVQVFNVSTMDLKRDAIRILCILLIGAILILYTNIFSISDPTFGYEDVYGDTHPFY